MLRKIQEVATLSGVTVRTLQYYDRIGLLRPSMLTDAGYRLYDEEAIERLQQILFFRELDFPLKQIAQIMSAPDYDRQGALTRHRALLLAKRSRLDGLINLVESTIKGDNTMEFKPFDMQEIERAKKEYAAEVTERWGGTDAYAQSARKTSAYGAQDWELLQREANEIFAGFAALVGTDPADARVQTLVANWQAHLTAHYYDATREILAGLGQMYVCDDRFTANLNEFGAGTAQLMSDAIAVYCKQ